MSRNTRSLTRAAMVAAVYAALTLALAPISFGAVQFRAAEAMTILPIFMAEAVPGLAIGCLLANILGGATIFDIVFGAMATLLAAMTTRYFRSRPVIALAAPVVFNTLIVGPVVYFCYVMADGLFSPAALAFTCLSVGIGEFVVVYALGGVLYRCSRRISALA